MVSLINKLPCVCVHCFCWWMIIMRTICLPAYLSGELFFNCTTPRAACAHIVRNFFNLDCIGKKKMMKNVVQKIEIAKQEHLEAFPWLAGSSSSAASSTSIITFSWALAKSAHSRYWAARMRYKLAEMLQTCRQSTDSSNRLWEHPGSAPLSTYKLRIKKSIWDESASHPLAQTSAFFFTINFFFFFFLFCFKMENFAY